MLVLSKFRRLIKSRTFRSVTAIRLMLVIFTSMSISFVFVFGPYLQAAFTALLSGDQSSLYDGMYAGGVGNFPSFGFLMKLAFWPPYLLCGAAVALTMVWSNTKRRFLIQVTFVAAIGLTAIDMMGGDSDLHLMSVSIICNFIGGAVLALVSLIIVANASSITRFVSDGNKYVERIVWTFWPAVCYLIFGCALFLVTEFIIKIPLTTVSIRLSPPMSGYVSSIDPVECSLFKASNGGDSANCASMASSKDNDAEKFGVLSEFSPVKSGEKKWLGLGKELVVNWKKKNSAVVSATYRMVQGCQTRGQLKQMLKLPFFERDADIGGLLISTNKGLTQFQIIDSDYTGKINLNDKDSTISEFLINLSTTDSSKLIVNRFVDNGSLHFTDQFKTINYEIGLSPFTGERGSPMMKSRRLNLVEGGSRTTRFIDIKFDDGPINPNLVVGCTELKVKALKGGYSATAITPDVSLIVSIDHAKEVTYSDLERPDIIEVNGINGWVSSDGFEKARVDNIVKSGRFGMLSAFGAVSDVQVNEKVFGVGPTSTVQLSGKLFGTSDGPSILITGKADYMTLNDHRMTPTRWESLDIEMRVAIILGVPTILLFLLALLREALRRPMRHLWYLPR